MPFRGHRFIEHPDGGDDDAWVQLTCGHCGTLVLGAVIATGKDDNNWLIRWVQCPNCHDGSVFHDLGKRIYPGAAFGPIIEGIPEPVNSAYLQVRDCMSVSAFTAAELLCRKILMHIAVDKGAEEGKSFAKYLNYLESTGYITPPMKAWVNLIREHGNQAAHEISEPDRTRAESTVMFTAELLRLVYEMEYLANKYVPELET